MTKKQIKEKSLTEKLLKLKKFRITRYKINEAGKLQARQDGYVCKTPDVIGLEEMVGVKHEENKLLRKGNIRLEKDVKNLVKTIADYGAQTGNYKALLGDAMDLLKAHDQKDAELILEARKRIGVLGYWRRLFSALLAK